MFENSAVRWGVAWHGVRCVLRRPGTWRVPTQKRDRTMPRNLSINAHFRGQADRHIPRLRYAGQDFSLPVRVEPSKYANGYAVTVHAAFNEVHQSKFGYHDSEQALEVVNIHLVATACRALDRLPAPPPPRNARAPRASRPVYLDSAENPVNCAVFQREALRPGKSIPGPAVIHEYASTTLLFPDDTARVAESGDLIITLGGLPCH